MTARPCRLELALLAAGWYGWQLCSAPAPPPAQGGGGSTNGVAGELPPEPQLTGLLSGVQDVGVLSALDHLEAAGEGRGRVRA